MHQQSDIQFFYPHQNGKTHIKLPMFITETIAMQPHPSFWTSPEAATPPSPSNQACSLAGEGGAYSYRRYGGGSGGDITGTGSLAANEVQPRASVSIPLSANSSPREGGVASPCPCFRGIPPFPWQRYPSPPPPGPDSSHLSPLSLSLSLAGWHGSGF